MKNFKFDFQNVWNSSIKAIFKQSKSKFEYQKKNQPHPHTQTRPVFVSIFGTQHRFLVRGLRWSDSGFLSPSKSKKKHDGTEIV